MIWLKTSLSKTLKIKFNKEMGRKSPRHLGVEILSRASTTDLFQGEGKRGSFSEALKIHTNIGQKTGRAAIKNRCGMSVHCLRSRLPNGNPNIMLSDLSKVEFSIRLLLANLL